MAQATLVSKRIDGDWIYTTVSMVVNYKPQVFEVRHFQPKTLEEIYTNIRNAYETERQKSLVSESLPDLMDEIPAEGTTINV